MGFDKGVPGLARYSTFVRPSVDSESEGLGHPQFRVEAHPWNEIMVTEDSISI